jgi:hypothetical protein
MVMLSLNAGADLYRHGKLKDGTHNFWTTLISVGIWVTILWFGGFWK